MSKSLAAICLPLGLLLASVAGCGGVASEPQPPQPPIVESVAAEPVQEHQGPAEGDSREPATAEYDDVGTETTGTSAVTVAAPPEAVAQPPAEAVSATSTAVAEPNTTSPSSNASQAEETAETVPLEVLATTEPGQASVNEPHAPEPNGVTPSVPEESATVAAAVEPSQAREDEPDVLASFYRGYAEILQEHALEDGRMDYESLRRKRLRLKQLLSELDGLDPDVYRGWPEDEKLAFWINAYNLKMLDIIARNYPIQSSWWLRLTWPPSDIRHIDGIWSNYRFIVMDEEFTLGEVEQRFFRKTFGDPRASLAITYAARSGPSLRRTPYRGSELDRQLDGQVKAFLSADRTFRIDRDKGIVYLSALFKPSWKGKDFVAQYATQKKFKSRPAEMRAVLNFLTRYVSREDVYFLEVENYEITYVNFDWRLNDSSRGY